MNMLSYRCVHPITVLFIVFLQEQKWNHKHNTMKLSTGQGFSYLQKNTGHLAYPTKDDETSQSYVVPFCGAKL